MRMDVELGLARVRAAFAGTSLATHGFLPATAPRDALPAPFDAHAEGARELAERYHGPGKDVRPWLLDRFARSEHDWETAILPLSQPELDGAMTVVSTLAHAFRWGAMPAPAASCALARVDLPPGLEGPLVALSTRLALPRCANLHHLVINNWRAPGVAPGKPYEPTALRAAQSSGGAGLSTLWSWLLPPSDRALDGVVGSIVQSEAWGAGILDTIVKLLEAAARRDTLESSFLLDKLRAGIAALGRVFVEHVRAPRIAPAEFMNVIQPHMLWGLERDGERLDGASGAQAPILQALDSVLGVRRASPAGQVVLAARAYLPAAQRRFLDALDGVTHVVPELASGAANPTIRELFNECVEGLLFWRRAHQKRGALYMRAEAPNYASVSGVVEVQSGALRSARFEAEMEGHVRETLDGLLTTSQHEPSTLASTFVFLSTDDLDLLVSRAERRRYAPSEVVLAEGSRRQGLFIVRAGLVHIHRVIRHEPVTLRSLGPGEIFGEVAFIDNSAASAWVVAGEGCEVDVIAPEHLYGLLADPPWASRFFQSLAVTLARRFREGTKALPSLVASEQRLLARPRLSPGGASADDDAAPPQTDVSRRALLLAIEAETALLAGDEDAAREPVERAGAALLAALAADTGLAPAAIERRAAELLRASFGWLMASETVARAFRGTAPGRPFPPAFARGLLDASRPPSGTRAAGFAVEAWIRRLPTSRWFAAGPTQLEAQLRAACEAPSDELVAVTLVEPGASWSTLTSCADLPLAVTYLDPDPSLCAGVEGSGARFFAADVLRVARGEAHVTLAPQRLLVADLLLARLTDDEATQVLAWIHRSLADGGVAVLSSFDPASPDRFFWDDLLQISPRRRGAEELSGLFRRAGLGAGDVSISASPDGAALTIVCTKGVRSSREGGPPAAG